jgi:tRNA nucleotidyltransferase/poly(A) polymerase
LSAERVWSELGRILAAPDPGPAVGLMADLGVLAAVIPEGADPAALARLIDTGAPDDPLLRLAALLTGDVAPVADRLRLSAAERQRLLDLRTTPLARPGDDDAALRRLLADHDRATLIDRTWLAATSPASSSRSDATALRARLAALSQPVFPLEGRDVLALGEPSGPRVGALLRATRAWWLRGGCVAGAEDCRAELLRIRTGPDTATGLAVAQRDAREP